MGCCFGKESYEEGIRPGTVNKGRISTNHKKEEEIHQPYIDKNIDDTTRERLRAEREAAALARMKKNQIGKVTKKKTSSSSPLRGPNTKNIMTWTV
mmetsp:Transcript_28111/g.34721  ORF Transcript_28111/g.34721 Transcript_28111/m.34721 type:complete len:96 (-) Transcript_28111:468-755(-)